MADTCETCRFLGALNACRRYPPALQVNASMKFETGWPKVSAKWWCGEHQPRKEE